MNPKLIQLSKGMSWLLRHGALKAGVPMEKDGSVSMQDLLAGGRLNGKYTAEDVLLVIKHNDKQRFELIGSAPNFRVRARQGHSQEVGSFVDTAALMTQITEAPPVCVHGTYLRFWDAIKATGLNRMTRQHIHFTDLAEREGQDKISGFRGDAEILIYVDAAKAMQEGCIFFRANNGVILSEGFGGLLPIKFFAKVTTREGKELDLPTQVEIPGDVEVDPAQVCTESGEGAAESGEQGAGRGGDGSAPRGRGRRRVGASRVELHRE
eukprot:CAMPEP_0177713800 /NCGR_PEP_ID=MMETSP0484_2-20121128/13129_1 /TAXON_ID=354590 /ORGANISM="Rhodomonas lens, Strain RHODO" /LENGTH=265 /DNA_ID=CAMNT_0019225707 /DNA_START=33 /DNA_END=830 /DNA_ORIENTATION=-